jgi:hypothetical protein
VEEKESRSFSASQMRKVEIVTRNGRIESNTWDDSSIHITFRKWATGDYVQEAEDNLLDIRISVSEDDISGILNIDVDYPNRPGTNYGCDISLNLPSTIFLDLETSNGAINVSGSQDGLMCFTSNGAISIIDTDGRADLKTSNGEIVVRNHSGELYGRTSNGRIKADVVLPRRGECVLKTSNGAVTLSIPNTTSAMIQAATSNGIVEVSELDANVIKAKKTKFKGRMGDGEGNIDIETSNGNVLLRRSF